MPDKWDGIAQEAYKAYAQAVDNKSVHGEELPSWESMSKKVKQAWIEAIRRAVEVSLLQTTSGR